MPKLVKEVSPGVQYEFSAEEGTVAASTTRVFRILKNNVGEYINISQECGIQVGNEHPTESGLYCVSYSAQYDGDSRMLIVATFNYRTTPSVGADDGGSGGGQDGKSQPPDVRPPNVAFNTTLTESPVFTWKPLRAAQAQAIGGGVAWRTPTNPAGDRYEGVTRLVPVTTISLEMFKTSPPLDVAQYAGYINEQPLVINNLTMQTHTVMFRGVSIQPTVEHYGNLIYRGWKCTYEFLYKKNPMYVSKQDGTMEFVSLGWDHAQPVSGINIINTPFASEAAANAAGVEAGSLALKRKEADDIGYEIVGWPGAIAVADNTANKKVRGMIIVGEGAKPTQRPCALPIPLNANGSPRWSGLANPVLIYPYQVQQETDFNDFDLRIQ